MRIGTTEIVMILIVVLIIFGPKNLPKLGKMFGQTMKGFKEGIDDEDEDASKKAETKTESKNNEE
ncbi:MULTISPECIES: twin-arginine translocase TatA/TatE family subunit [unclassified Faecalibacterium]|uniref:twin-arginine translocase TatA/TatE family subunit n=1 Tax=unclassified Faecalibacterium TaxID=2646395 RepID=UPI000B3824A9|nr:MULTISPECIES: twin-arginine translocase TatA/TatE family subunit [unclassified Faecalibacterium]OUN40162.1 twin-arginine translocase TatA/TatE family subunit [Faecalibacterium sp. An77]OUP27653.1 twin-arginine translocase TatA/TatE family subunit [Faecalibacterium sp. An192]OUQ36751.1 twin-arginine translocase TatA/TatE family subunit [Faecalibacterium sp. An122]